MTEWKDGESESESAHERVKRGKEERRLRKSKTKRNGVVKNADTVIELWRVCETGVTVDLLQSTPVGVNSGR